MAERWGWWGFEIPFRKCHGTYNRYTYDSLPPVQIKKEYENIELPEQLRRALPQLKKTTPQLFNSPTACFFKFGVKGLFYCDQQGCILWYVDKETKRVHTDDATIVAKSLPEFLTRIEMENALWKHTLSPEMFPSIALLPQHLTDEQKAYIEHYRNTAR